MLRLATTKLFFVALLIIAMLSPLSLPADDVVESAGIGIGITAGNMWFVPIKAISLYWGLAEGALSFVLSGGNLELTKQIWRDTSEGPYLISPETARTAIGERPELEKRSGVSGFESRTASSSP